MSHDLEKLTDFDLDGFLAFDKRISRELTSEVHQRKEAIEQARQRKVRKALKKRRQKARRSVG